MKNVYIIIVNYNGQKDTVECLRSLQKIYHKNFSIHIVIVDNDPENRINILEKDYREINLKIIFSPKNLGFSGGNNLGITEAINNKADYILLLNNDTLVSEDFLEKLIEFAEKNPKFGLISPKIYFAKGFEFHKDRYGKEDLGKVIWYAGGVMDWKNVIGLHRGVDKVDKGQFDDEEETDFASGCCMLIKKSVIEDIGLLDEKYFLYYEDNDYSIRTKNAGYRIVYQPKSIIWHKNAGSTGGSGSKLQDYYITRNRLLFGNRYASIRSKIALNREAMRLFISGRDMQKKGVIDYFAKNFGHFEKI